MKIGVVGSGKIVPDFLKAAAQVEDCQIVAIAARNRGAMEKLADEYNIPVRYSHYSELLQDPDVEAVYVALPNNLHELAARQALESGRHVLLEKPTVATRREMEGLYALAKERGVGVFEMMTSRYHPNFEEVRRRLPEIGQVRVVQMNFSQFSSRYERFKAGDIAPAFDPKLGGGALLDLNIYNIALAVGWFGRPSGVHYYPNMERGVDISGVLVLNYEGFQCVCIAAKDCGAPSGFQLQGEDGCITSNVTPSLLTEFTLQLREGRTETVALTGSDPIPRLQPELAAINGALNAGEGLELSRRMEEVTVLCAEVLERAMADAKLSAFDVPEQLF